MTPVIRCILLQGIPGSGKSTLAEKLKMEADQNPNNKTIIYCVTDYFYRNGTYQFNRHKLSEFYSLCMMRFAVDTTSFLLNRAEGQTLTVIVDNQNIGHYAIRPYFHWMKSLQISNQKVPMSFELIEPETYWRYNPEECVRKSKHDTTHEICQQALLELKKFKNFELPDKTIVNQYDQYTLRRSPRYGDSKTN